MRIGILGIGNMGKAHAKVYKRIPEVTISGVCGRNVTKTDEFAKKIDTKPYTDCQALLKDKNIDIVDVCLPVGLHSEWVIKALEAGKDVICEIPLCYSVEEMEKMRIAARKNGKRVMVALYNRFQSQYKYIYEYIKSGKIGKPKAVFANRRSPNYYASKDIVVDLMQHDFDYIYWLLGKPRSVFCKGIASLEGIDQHAVAVLEYDTGLVTVEGTTSMPDTFPFSTSLRVIGETGAIDLNWNWNSKGPVNDVRLYPETGETTKLEIADYDPYFAECKYMVECIENKAKAELLDLESVYDSIRLIFLARESLRQGGVKIGVY
jgi:UDP-N-acetylglucosamine 3-dehydrogenase